MIQHQTNAERDAMMPAVHFALDKARALIALHDELINFAEVDESPLNDDEAFTRWCAAVDELRAALDKVNPQ